MNSFNAAPLGTAALEACGACGLETGTILIKTRGSINKNYTGPRLVQNSEARCEFCRFLGIWIQHEKHDIEKDGKVGAAKIVFRDEDGSEELVAYLPFTEKDSLDKTLADGTEFQIRHGMVIRAEKEGPVTKLVEILKKGI